MLRTRSPRCLTSCAGVLLVLEPPECTTIALPETGGENVDCSNEDDTGTVSQKTKEDVYEVHNGVCVH